MKKKLCALLFGINLAFVMPLSAFATEGEVIKTGTQERAIENEVDVDEDIKEDIEAEISEEIEEINISSVEDFLKFSENCKLDTWSVNKRVILNADISLLGTNFEGVPTFAGEFVGNGHTISDFTIGKDISHMGLFVTLQKTGSISDLKVKASILPSGENIIIGGIVSDNSGHIQNCEFEGVITANDYIGGIAGINQLSGDIKGCTTRGFIHGVHYVGGIAGENMGNIYGCTNEALVNTTNEDTQITIDSMSTLNKVISLVKNLNNTAEEANADVTASDIGGIAGLSIGIIGRSINIGNVGYEHVGYNIGGIAGRQSGYLYYCTNNGNVLGRKDVGGIVGQAEPYVTVDLSSDIAYQLSEAIGKLHDIVTVTLNDTRNQSNTISSRLSAIQQFTDGAIKDVKYIAQGTIDYANGVSGAATEAFSRVDYVLDESSKQDGALDQVSYAAEDLHNSAGSLKDTAKDLDLEQYMDEDQKEQYNNALDVLEGLESQYDALFESKFFEKYNEYLKIHRSVEEETEDLIYVLGDGTELEEDVRDGIWKHSKDDAKFPVSDDTDTRYSVDQTLHRNAEEDATGEADRYARGNYQSPVTGDNGEDAYIDDLTTSSATVVAIASEATSKMTDATREDAVKAMNSFEKATEHLKEAGNDTKAIVKNVAGRDDIVLPQFSSEYRARTTSFVDNMQGMNDNFGLLNSEMNNATGVIVDDLQEMNDQFNTIMMLFSDAVDGVLEADYTSNYEDVSFDEAEVCTDATIDWCINYGDVAGDIDTSGIAGTMAIEYDFDKESDATGIKDSKLNSSYLTKCVLRNNKNYSSATGEKNYVGGICGLQEMGTILKCSNLGNLKSNSGQYTGGVCGRSLSYVVNSSSMGILSGESYVGGITGDGQNISDCLSLVKIENAASFYGAISGHISDDGVVRNNTFISDDLAGIDRTSQSLKAEPVSFSESDLPYDFKNLTVSFILEDENIDGGEKLIKKVSKRYGEKMTLDNYPEIEPREGYYVSWDQDSIDSIKTDEIITASYMKYRTTISEDTSKNEDGFYQAEILVDGQFKENDMLKVTHTLHYDDRNFEKVANIKDLVKYETAVVEIPDDGASVHDVRIKPLVELAKGFKEYDVYLVNGDEQILLEKKGKLGNYNIYEIEGNSFTLDIKFNGADKAVYLVILGIVGIIAGILLIIILIIVFIVRHGGKLPGILNKIGGKISEKIENKEQIFYDESTENVNEEDEKINKND
ncbi:hypothetical protein SAMN04487928_11281 [Butyrivibrio proteoclasticus]|uniref:GLUG domain-containing protein n=1 Tax=Butyrivibrio proteoclasticus TaxID=43305 RepID=A0A1I5UEA4_9FIRM|nr:hypothetical protein [Butyrivibrio proteoclasticus]SFP93610.1 hypothetical protein SAMN04487928_11281 [Butyrivibrio proteoclasticus]